IEAGAKLMGVAPGQCTARNGKVVAGGRSITYGEIARRGGPARSFTPEEVDKMPIKPVSERRLIGRPTKALDVAGKVDGTARYGIDAKVPGMVYARPKLPPTRTGSKVTLIDDSAARKVKGYLKSIAIDDPSDTVPGWVLVVAQTYPAAIRAT